MVKAMKHMSTFLILLNLCAILAAADVIALKDGRQLQGKYVGGTSSTVGFMTGGSIQYFPTAEVVAVIFERSPYSGSDFQPNPTKQRVPARHHLLLKKIELVQAHSLRE